MNTKLSIVLILSSVFFSPHLRAGNDPNTRAIRELNQMRQQYGLPAVTPDARLAARCEEWASEMNDRGVLEHDPRVYGTEERENIAGASGYAMTVEEAMQLWQSSPPHAASMFDEGFPTAVIGGYAQVGGYACLRLCPQMQRSASGPCS